MADHIYNTTFRDSPPESEDHGRGGLRIRDLKDVVRRRLSPEHNVGNGTIATGYTDDGRHNPGSAVAFRGVGLPTQLLRPDATSSTGNPSVGSSASAFSATLGQADLGRVWVDQSGGADVFRYLQDTTTTPDQWPTVQGFNNHIMNGGFQIWQRNTSFSCPAAAETFTADRWYVNPTGATMPVARSAVPSGFATPRRGARGMVLTAANLITSFIVGTRIEADNVHRLRNVGFLNFSARILNNATGVTITPTFTIRTADASNNFGAVTLANTQALPAIASATEAYVSHAFDSSAFANFNGLEIELSFAVGGGGFTGAGSVLIGEVILEWGRSRSHFVEPPFDLELRQCQRYFEKTTPYATVPVAGAAVLGALVIKADSTGTAWRTAPVPWVFKAPKMRSDYTLAFFTPVGAGATWYNLNDAVAANAGTSLPSSTIVSSDTRGDHQATITSQTINGADQNDMLATHATCEAELL